MSMRIFFIAVFFALFSFVPVTSAGSVPAGGSCPNGVSDCVSSLACVSGTCQNVSLAPANTGVTLINPLNSGNCAPNGDCLMNFLTKILEFVIRIGSVVVILMMVYVGYLFVTAQGEPGKITTARQALLWTLVGALILLGSQAIALAIKATVAAISTGG